MARSGLLADRAIAGFETDFISGPTSKTDLHGAKVYEKLSQGFTLQQAVLFANEQVEILQSAINEEVAEMTVDGDSNSTIKGVYSGSEMSSRPCFMVLQ